MHTNLNFCRSLSSVNVLAAVNLYPCTNNKNKTLVTIAVTLKPENHDLILFAFQEKYRAVEVDMAAVSLER